MAGASTSVYEFDSVVRGQHIYKSVWTSLTDWCSKTRKCILVLENNKSDNSAALPGIYLSSCMYLSPALIRINTAHTILSH